MRYSLYIVEVELPSFIRIENLELHDNTRKLPGRPQLYTAQSALFFLILTLPTDKMTTVPVLDQVKVFQSDKQMFSQQDRLD